MSNDLRNVAKRILQERDRIAPSSGQTKVYVAGAELLNSNGEPPYVRILSDQEALVLAGLEERALVYEIRIVCEVADAVYARLDVGAAWAISHDGGTTLLPCRVLPPLRRDPTQTGFTIRLVRYS